MSKDELDIPIEREKRVSPLYRLIRWLARSFSPKYTVHGSENLPAEPAVIVGNHSQMQGPIAAELYLPRPRYTWCIAEMMVLREVPAYAFQDFWSRKPRSVRWFFRLASYLIAPISVLVFTNANTIPVYHDRRLLSTFKLSEECLEKGMDVVIFPEEDTPHNQIVYQFQDGFVDVAKRHYRKTGEALAFVPMYLSPRLGELHLGEPVYYDPEVPAAEERERIAGILMERITQMALALPAHTVVPYRNVAKSEYPLSKPEEVDQQ